MTAETVVNVDRAIAYADRLLAGTRKCVGSTRYGIESHEAPTTDFPLQPSAKDGLGRMCKPHWRTYVSGLAHDAKARATATLTPEQEAEIAERQAETGETIEPKRGRDRQAEVVASLTKASPTATGGTIKIGLVRKATADALAAQRAEHVALERQLLVVGGSGTDAGQAILEAAATKAAEARTSRRGAKAVEPVEQEGASE